MESDQLNSRQIHVIAHFLTSPSVEETCRKANLSKATFYKWLKEAAFKDEIKRQRKQLIESALNRIKCSITKASEELIKLLNSPREDIRRLVSKDIIEYALKSIELDEIEQRLSRLEKTISARKA